MSQSDKLHEISEKVDNLERTLESLHQLFDKQKLGFGLNGKKWLTTKETATYLGVSQKALQGMIYRGEISPSYPDYDPSKKTRRRYFRRLEIDAWIEGKL